MYNPYIKRALDLILSVSGLVLLCPLLLLIALLIKLDSPGPVFFLQKRVGKGKKNFNIIKFRSMRKDSPHDIPTHLFSASEAYLTRMGRILRKTSLDELPQLLNIVAGQMSVIGPRPALWNQADLIAARDAYGANDVLPGLTGWAQINGRDELEIDQKAALDGEYVRRMSFLFDCKCFFGTFAAVFTHKGIVEGGTGALHNDHNKTGKSQ